MHLAAHSTPPQEAEMKRTSKLFAVAAATLLLSVAAAAQSRYTQFGNLNNNSVNVTSAWTKLNTTNGAHAFKKVSDKTKLEVFLNSRFAVGSITGGASGVRFQVRIDDKVVPTFDNMGSILTGTTREFLSIFAVFEDLPAGNHTVSIWAIAPPSGAASNVLVDPGGWGGKIIVKETP
jgi:hypothetical protein